MKTLCTFRLRSINKLLQFVGIRLAVAYETNEDGEIIAGQPVKIAVVWWGFKDRIPLLS